MISQDARFHRAAVRQVNALVYDNDTPGVYVTEVEPGGTALDGRTLVIEGSTLTQRTDDLLLTLAKAPAAGHTIWVKIWMDADSQRLIQLDFSLVPAGRWLAFSDGNGGTYYSVSFRRRQLEHPAADRGQRPPRTATRATRRRPSSTTNSTPCSPPPRRPPPTRSRTCAAGCSAPTCWCTTTRRRNVVSIPTGTDTVVIQCGNTACTIPGGTDGYTIRLTKAPNGDVADRSDPGRPGGRGVRWRRRQ